MPQRKEVGIPEERITRQNAMAETEGHRCLLGTNNSIWEHHYIHCETMSLCLDPLGDAMLRVIVEICAGED